MTTFAKAFKRWLCGCPRPSEVRDNLPPEIRGASHALNNAASILHGSVFRLRKVTDALAELQADIEREDHGR